jgi:hypothetical protein
MVGKVSNKGGRPQKNIKPEMVEKLASIGCTGDEIATVLGCCRDTLYDSFSDSLKRGSTKRKLRCAACSGSPQFLAM